ncbi:MAG: J domain-containing protein [Phycisphaerales bacterium]
MNQNPFEILELSPTFAITADQIQRAYLQKLSTVHPDLGMGDTQPAVDPASLNQARDTLNSDEARANLVLDLLGGPSASDTSLPDGFLMEMMMVRTQIDEEVEEEGDQARDRWEQWAAERREKTILEVTQLFEKAQSVEAADTQPVFNELRMTLNAWRYTERLIEQLDPTYDPARSDF